MNNIFKTFLVIIGANLVENILLLLMFGIEITQQTFIAAAVFTFVLTFVLNYFDLIPKNGQKS